MNQPTYQRRRGLAPTLPDNRLITLVRTVPGDASAAPIVREFDHRYIRLNDGASYPGSLIRYLPKERRRTFFWDLPYPMLSKDVPILSGLPPRFFTHSVLIVPGASDIYELDGPMEQIRTRVDAEVPTALALGDMSRVYPDVQGATSWDMLPEPVLSLVRYLEVHYGVPVLFLATGETVVTPKGVM